MYLQKHEHIWVNVYFQMDTNILLQYKTVALKL